MESMSTEHRDDEEEELERIRLASSSSGSGASPGDSPPPSPARLGDDSLLRRSQQAFGNNSSFYRQRNFSRAGLTVGTLTLVAGTALFITSAVLSLGLAWVLVGASVAIAAVALIIISAIMNAKLKQISTNTSVGTPRYVTDVSSSPKR